MAQWLPWYNSLQTETENKRIKTDNKMKKTLLFVLALAVICAMPSCKKDPNGGNTTNENDSIVDHSGTFNGHDYVDLGLPSGTLWATCNVGADTPEGCGDYFAWAETETKEVYNWETYKYCNGAHDQLTRYCPYSEYGYQGVVHDRTVLYDMDDAALSEWGTGWRMPTRNEMEELLFCTTSRSWKEQNGVEGLLFEASNGNSLFFPAAGFVNETELAGVGEQGCYWSSSLGSDPDKGGTMYFVKQSLSFGQAYRCFGWTIRPVRNVDTNAISN